MKKLIAALTFAISLLFTTPTLAHTVQTGDTMAKIAEENHLTLQELAELNPQIENLDLIYVGQTVHINKIEADSAASATLASLEARVDVAKIRSDQTTTEPANAVKVPPFSQSEIDLLARLVRAEAETEPYEGKVAVACVVLNRLESPKFPDTIKEVIYQKRQFQPVSNGQINKPADEDSIKAVYEALNDKRTLAQDSLFFYNPVIATSRWLDSRATTIAIGDHVFKK
ncbi:cell wall hydrolase [Neobacillus niacini]|uniref:cell wall hydrolase n=1 Tax=Neobacillus niacini TaxID=86668 RepID=UPI0021CB7202|nr:cell wall hydrolase [Neobacillus niacini]MCM3766930.1 cell wall hydrolase [Neobacillus niacini]